MFSVSRSSPNRVSAWLLLLVLPVIVLESALLVVSMPIAFGLLTVIAVAVLVLKVPSPVLAATAILTSTLMVYRYDIGLFQVSPYRLLLILALMRIVWEWLNQKRQPRVDGLWWLLTIMVVWDAIGASYSPDTSRGIQFVGQEIEFVVAYFIIANSVRKPKDFSLLIKAFIGSVAIAIGFGFLQWLNVFVLGRPFTWPFWNYVHLSEARGAQWLAVVGVRSPGMYRVGSVLGDPAQFAHLLALALVLVSGRWLLSTKDTSRTNRLRLVVFIVSAIVMLVVSWGRAGILATVIGVLCLLVVLPNNTPGMIIKRSLGVIVSAMIAIFVITWLSSALPSQYDAIGGLIEKTSRDLNSLMAERDNTPSSLVRRLYLQGVAIETWMSNPLLGVGTGGMLASTDVQGVHNTWLARLAENGILGFIIVSAIYAQLGRLALRSWKKGRAKFRGSQTQPTWSDVFHWYSPVLLVQLLIFAVTWGYWWMPFYIITFAFLSLSATLVDAKTPPGSTQPSRAVE